MMPHSSDGTITFCYRGFAANWGTRHEVALILDRSGKNVRQVKDGPADLAPGDILWIWGNTNWYPGLYSQLRAMPVGTRPTVVLWHTEPLPPPRAAGLPWPRLNWWEAGKFLLRDRNATDVYTNHFMVRRWMKHGLLDLLVTATKGRQEFLSERGIAAEWVPLGYDAAYGQDLGLARDLEVLFLGAPDVPRRKRILGNLRRKGIAVEVVGSYTDPRCWGQDRTRLLNRAKILLNLARTAGEFPDHRLILGMANKALVISEPIYSHQPFVSGRHFVSTSIEEMPETIRYYLTHDKERTAICDQAYELVTRDLTMVRSVERILELLAARCAPAGRLC